MATSEEEGFDSWLSKKLLSLNSETDLDVFVPYIRSILETESDPDDLLDSLQGIIQEISDQEVEANCMDVIKQWESFSAKEKDSPKAAGDGASSLDQQISSIISQQQQQVIKTRALTKDDLERQEAKQAILQQYAKVSDGDESSSDEETGDLAQNVNTKLVVDREKSEREKSKASSAQMKEKNKDDREKQKQKADDRKDSEKKRTQKSERRR